MKTITRKIKYKMGELVCLKVEPDVMRCISGYLIKGRSITYGLANSEDESWHNECEIEPYKRTEPIKGFR